MSNENMNNGDKIFAMLSEILEQDFEIDAEDITYSANLYEDLDLDSIDAVDLVVKLREQTGKKIEPNDFKQVRTVQDVIDAVEKLMTEDA
ncbi:Acyl carrier protein [Pseudoalteromonas sp. P1-13-1a]|nr:Acyl carrier protein [Pseudoalteromonas sp. P1-13-1a]